MKRILSLVIVLICLVTFTIGCGTSNNNQGSTTGTSNTPAKDTLKIAYSLFVDTLDCNLTATNMAEKVFANIYATMLRFDDNYKPQPYVAKSWEVSADKLTYTFKIRDDIKFYDGKKLTAQDVAYSLQKSHDSKYNGPLLSAVKEFKVVDDYTVALVLKAPYAPLLNVLCEPLIGIFCKEDYEKSPDSFKTNPISCGPFKVKEYVADNKLVIERFDDFFGGAVPFKEVEIKYILDETAKTISLQNGEVDVAENISTTDRQNVLSDSKLKFLEAPSTRFYHLSINNQNDKFKDIKIRQAICYAINKKAIIATAADEIGKEAECTINEACFGFPEGFKDTEYSVEKAKQLLTEAGKVGFKVELLTTATESNKKMAETIRADLNAAGFDCTTKYTEKGGYYDALEKGNYEITTLSWSDSIMDADAVVAARFVSGNFGLAGNISRISDSNLDKLIADARSTDDVQKRKDLYKQMFEYVRDQAYEKPLYFSINNLGFNKDLKIKSALPTGIYYYTDWSW